MLGSLLSCECEVTQEGREVDGYVHPLINRRECRLHLKRDGDAMSTFTGEIGMPLALS